MNAGGVAAHSTSAWLEGCRENGVEFVYLGPLRDDAAEFLDAEWLPLRPNTDTAVMLGLAHTLVAEGLHDAAFLDRCTVGFERFLPYLIGETDGRPKDAECAGAISGRPSARLRVVWRRAARCSRSAGRCSARTTASSRTGWR